MPSTPSITEVAQAAGVTRADVIRLLREGGTTETDWRIAREIEKAGGRRASELMLTAGRDHMIERIWGDSGEIPQVPAPTNPRAIHDPEVTVYDEPTDPDAPPTVLPDHPHEDTPSEDEVQAHTEGTTAWRELTIWPGIARITGDRERTDRLMARWTTTRAIHRGVKNLLRATCTRRPRLRALVASYTLTA